MASGPEEYKTLTVKERLAFWKQNEQDEDKTLPLNKSDRMKMEVKELVRSSNSDVMSPSSKIKTTETLDTAAAQAPVLRKSGNNLRIVLFGKTGVGKSATCNTILGVKCSEEKRSQSSVTKECDIFTKQCKDGREVSVVDTPGLFDTDRTQEETKDSIIKCIELCSPGPHAFLLILSCISRFTEEEEQTLMELKRLFGEAIYRHTIVLFTNLNSLGETSIEEFSATFPKPLQDIVNACNGRVVYVENSDVEAKGNYAGTIFAMIDDLVRSEGHYTDKLFTVGPRESLKEEMDERISMLAEEKIKMTEELKRQVEILENKDRNRRTVVCETTEDSNEQIEEEEDIYVDEWQSKTTQEEKRKMAKLKKGIKQLEKVQSCLIL